MSKPIHPIRKLAKAVDPWNRSIVERERIIARHVKPLLDALADTHELEGRALYPNEAEEGCPYDPCWICDLLAEWRASCQ